MALKTVMFQVRVSPEDHQRIQATAETEFLSISTWVRRAVLSAVAHAEVQRQSRHPPKTRARQDTN